MKISADLQFKLICAALVVGGVWYVVNKVAGKIEDAGSAVVDAAEAVAPYVNPADTRNVVYGGVSSVGAAVTGDSSWTLGTGIYNATHRDEVSGKWWWQ